MPVVVAICIFVDDDFDTPLYADPGANELDEGLWQTICEASMDAIEGEGETQGTTEFGETIIGWRYLAKQGLTFAVAVNDDIKPSGVNKYLRAVAKRYLDEVDDVRNPDRHGVADVIVDVIPPWEDEED